MIENGISRGEINCPGKKKLTETYNRFIKVEEAYDKIKEHESESRRNLFSECAEFDSTYLLLRDLSFLTGMDIQNIYINYPSIHSVVLHYMKLVSVAEQIIKEDESKELVTNPISSSAKNGQTTQESKKKATRSKASPLRNANSGKLDDLHPAVRIFKRFVALNGKEYNRTKVERILKSLQREIINHTITKDYEYASEVNNLQTKLVDTLNLETALGKQTGKIEIETDLLARLQHIIGEAKPADAITLLKSYVRLAGSTDKDKAKRLLKRFDRYNIETPSSALTPHLKSAKNALSDFVAGKSAAIALDEFALHGLNGSEGLDGILPSEKLQSLTFDTIPVEHPFNKLLGQPEIPFRVMIHGAPGSGKTTLGLRIAYSLAANNGLRTLVVSSEEGIGYKIQQRLNKLGLYHPNLFVSNRLPSDLAGYQVVLLDSIVSLGLNAEQLRTLYSENPETSFIIINQETKQGNSRGSLELEHDVDTIVRCQDMVATTLKNRFGSLDSMQIR